MKAHELAQKLLNGPNLDVMFEETSELRLINSTATSSINSMESYINFGNLSRLGDEVVILCN
jgi:hypothetical protein